jgi:hypothetical protein
MSETRAPEPLEERRVAFQPQEKEAVQKPDVKNQPRQHLQDGELLMTKTITRPRARSLRMNKRTLRTNQNRHLPSPQPARRRK